MESERKLNKLFTKPPLWWRNNCQGPSILPCKLAHSKLRAHVIALGMFLSSFRLHSFGEGCKSNANSEHTSDSRRTCSTLQQLLFDVSCTQGPDQERLFSRITQRHGSWSTSAPPASSLLLSPTSLQFEEKCLSKRKYFACRIFVLNTNVPRTVAAICRTLGDANSFFEHVLRSASPFCSYALRIWHRPTH